MFSVSHPQSGCCVPGSEEFREGQEITEGTVLTIYYSITNHPQTPKTTPLFLLLTSLQHGRPQQAALSLLHST